MRRYDSAGWFHRMVTQMRDALYSSFHPSSGATTRPSPHRRDAGGGGRLTDDEAAAILAACNRSTWIGRRDHTMITTLIDTGLRVSELINLARADARLQATGSHIHCIGKGRKERCTPLAPAAASTMKDWLEHTTQLLGRPCDAHRRPALDARRCLAAA